jgi:muramoyltetrapeptide carboxypeptidase
MITPPYLSKGDKVAVIATAKNFNAAALEIPLQVLSGWGLNVVTGKHLYKHHHQFAGTDKERAEDLQQALDSDEIKAIFCARGGYGTSRIIDQIDFSAFLKTPKWVVGFSDLTVLHCHLNGLGIETIHGLMPVQFGKKEYNHSLQRLQQVLFGEKLSYEIGLHPFNRDGISQNPIVGGNLTILHTIINTPSDLNYDHHILFIEDVGEHLYHLDRMMVHFKRAGMLSKLKGLIVGHFNDMKDSTIPFGKSAYEIIAESVKEYAFPVCFGFPAGHAADNLPVICGRCVMLEVISGTCRITFGPHADDLHSSGSRRKIQ